MAKHKYESSWATIYPYSSYKGVSPHLFQAPIGAVITVFPALPHLDFSLHTVVVFCF